MLHAGTGCSLDGVAAGLPAPCRPSRSRGPCGRPACASAAAGSSRPAVVLQDSMLFVRAQASGDNDI